MSLGNLRVQSSLQYSFIRASLQPPPTLQDDREHQRLKHKPSQAGPRPVVLATDHTCKTRNRPHLASTSGSSSTPGGIMQHHQLFISRYFVCVVTGRELLQRYRRLKCCRRACSRKFVLPPGSPRGSKVSRVPRCSCQAPLPTLHSYPQNCLHS